MTMDVRTTIAGVVAQLCIVFAFVFPRFVVMPPDVQNAVTGLLYTVYLAGMTYWAYYTNKKEVK